MSGIESLMIVGTGGMARLMARALKEKIPKLAISSRSPEKAKKLSTRLGVRWAVMDEAAEYNSVLLTAPPQSLPEAAAAISEKMRPGSLLMEISSIKVGVVERVNEKIPDGIEYISLHPLFGPSARRIRGYSIAVIPVRGEKFLNAVAGLFESIGLNVVVTSPQEHDEAMSMIQVAHHMAYLSLALSLWESLTPDMIAKYGTRSLRRTFMVLKMFRGNLGVIKEIQEMNVYGGRARAKLVECIERLGRMDPDAWENVKKALKELFRAV